ncbi:MAG: TetR/AcrR family transcriptional regulator [Actinomycetia bacterium]|nr:TetR/AcrR family transcriptional regulator [Actinomycetes bacterium]MCP5035941.1 TetR/AcrR family transcriptional regulator [Actinomycetes bacterium]
MSPTADVPTHTPSPSRARLTRDRVLAGAVALADKIGMEGFTIRKLAHELDVKPMTIYHHVPNKEAIIDGMVDRVFGEIDLPPTEVDWKSAVGQRARSARAVLARHPWAAPLMESRTTPGSETLRHHDAVLGCFRQAGFSVEMTAHAYALVDSYVYGFALQEANLPATGGQEMAELAGSITEQFSSDEYPYLVELTVEHILQPGYDFAAEFDFGLDLILNGLESLAESRS